MTNRNFKIHALIQRLENELLLGEALHFPEVSRLGDSTPRLKRAVGSNARGILEQTPLLEIFRRAAPAKPELREFALTLEPLRELPLWTAPLELKFTTALWQIPGGTWVAYVPVLQIEVVGDTEKQLVDRVPKQIEQALRRNRLTGSLWHLLALQRTSETSIETIKLTADIPTPKEAGTRNDSEKREQSVLKEVGVDLTLNELEEAFEYSAHAGRIADALAEPSPESVLLVGPSGVGKTAAFHELVRRRKELHFGRTPFWATSGSRLVAGMSGFGAWQERCDKLRKEASRTRAVLHLGNLVELMEVGKGMMIQQGIAGFLRPFIARGELLCVVECTPEQIPVIERHDPHLLGVFRRIDLTEPEQETASAILLSAADRISKEKDTELISVETLDMLDRLHRRYATYSAYPGRPLRFLKNLLGDRDTQVTDAEVYAAFSRETGLPRLMLDTSIPMKGADVHGFFGERIIGQPQGIELVTDMLATVKSGLARPRKPLASFLFVGPTGVGKTETAKALAEFLFSDRRKITRFDMSEYNTPAAVQRLIGGAFGEEGLLTSRVREQPFAVLLFDEFEKAHPQFFDLLLQVLGEARLTDAAGRLADFSNTVVIMTSNLGAEGFMQGGIGFGKASADPGEHFTKALQDFVRPELLNRIDRVVPFMPLNENAVLQIVKREIDLLRHRPGIRSTGTTLTVSDSAHKLLAERAYQPALGARPLKREIERSLLVPLAEALNTQPLQYALNANVTLQNNDLQLDVGPAIDEHEQPRTRALAEPWLAELTEYTTGLRRRYQRALESPKILQLRNEIFRLRRLIEMDQRRRKKHPSQAPSARAVQAEARLKSIRVVTRGFDDELAEVSRLEDQLALAVLGQSTTTEGPAREAFHTRERFWVNNLLELMRLDGQPSHGLQLWIYSHHNELMFELARAYHDWAKEHGFKVRAFWAQRELTQRDVRELQRRAEFDSYAREALNDHLEDEDAKSEGNWEPQTIVFPPVDTSTFLDSPREDTGAIMLRIEGENAGLSLALERGTHRFQLEGGNAPVDVEVRNFDISPRREELPIPKGMADGASLRRSYDMPQRRLHDECLKQFVVWPGSRLEVALERCIRGTFERELEKQVGL